MVDCSRDRVVSSVLLGILGCTQYAMLLLKSGYLVAFPPPAYSRGLKLLPLFAVVNHILIITFIVVFFLFFFGHLGGIAEILVLLGFPEMFGRRELSVLVGRATLGACGG